MEALFANWMFVCNFVICERSCHKLHNPLSCPPDWNFLFTNYKLNIVLGCDRHSDTLWRCFDICGIKGKHPCCCNHYDLCHHALLSSPSRRTWSDIWHVTILFWASSYCCHLLWHQWLDIMNICVYMYVWQHVHVYSHMWNCDMKWRYDTCWCKHHSSEVMW